MPVMKRTAPLDVAATASRLPAPVQRPAGMLLQALADLLGADTVANPSTPDVSMVAPTPLMAANPVQAAVLGRQLKLPIKWPIKKPSERLYWGSRSQLPRLPDPKRAVETPFTSFVTDNPDIADIFTLPREYGEILTHTAEGRPIKPGVVTEFDYFPSDRTLILEGPSAQKFIDDSAYQAQLAARARNYGYDAIVAKNVNEGIGDTTARGNVYALFNSEGMQNPRKFRFRR